MAKTCRGVSLGFVPLSANGRLNLEVLCWADHRPPHMRNRTVVEAEALFRLVEVAADDVGELLQLYMHVGVK